MSLTIKDIEARDGIRLTWNLWPVTSSSQESIPIAALYNVNFPVPELACEPIFCRECQAVLCPQMIIDFGARAWTCIFCSARNALPAYAHDISPSNLLPEMVDCNSTVTYLLNSTTKFPPIFFLLVDLCTYDAERHALMIRGVLQTLDLLPEDSLVGILSFDTNVNLATFTDDHVRTLYQFSGINAYSRDDIAKMAFSDIRSFIVPKRERYEQLRSFVSNCVPSPFIPSASNRNALRCSGAALSFAASLLESAFMGSPAQIMLFTQGGCNHGPGKAIPEIKDPDSEKVDIGAAEVFYQALGDRMNAAGHAVHIIAETIGDFGFAHFRFIATLTGGAMIMAQDFDEGIKTGSIHKLFEMDSAGLSRLGFDAKIAVRVSSNLVFKGFYGDGKAVGTGWRVGAVLPEMNITLLFENAKEVRNGDYGHIQIISQYARIDRRLVSRVTTFSRLFTADRHRMEQGFDQEAACVFQARAFMLKGINNVGDYENAIDKNLISFVKKYSQFERNNPRSVHLPDAMAYIPNYMFFFRRSILVQGDGISTDETTYFRLVLARISPDEALKMIKPSLVAFHYQGAVGPVELDNASLNPESILVFDSFHNVLLWRGAAVCNWIEEGIAEQPEYAFFKNVIQESRDYAQSLTNRMPYPQFNETDEGMSQGRILLHYLNPSTEGSAMTEKIDYNRYYETLCQHVVRSD